MVALLRRKTLFRKYTSFYLIIAGQYYPTTRYFLAFEKEEYSGIGGVAITKTGGGISYGTAFEGLKSAIKLFSVSVDVP